MIFSESEPAVAFGYGRASGRFGKDSSPPGNQRILSDHSSSSIGGAPFSEADRLFSFADLRIGKRKLSVLGALSEAPQSGTSGRFKLFSWPTGTGIFYLQWSGH